VLIFTKTTPQENYFRKLLGNEELEDDERAIVFNSTRRVDPRGLKNLSLVLAEEGRTTLCIDL
jgi:hypothetical protein